MSTELPNLVQPAADIGAAAETPSFRESRVRIVMAAGFVALAVVCLLVRLLDRPGSMTGQFPEWFSQAVVSRLQKISGEWSLASMLIYPFALLAILLLERVMPAVPSQRTLSNGLVHDALWVIVEAVVIVVFLGGYGRILYGLYDRYLSFLTLPLAGALPPLVLLVIGAIILDLMRWCQHWLHHHVRWLWPFHAVHHAQRELNLFSDYRIHFMEYLVRRPVAVLPMLMLGLDAPEVTWWLLLLAWHARLYHANIKSDFGVLRYVFVTPQSHRVHHSCRPEHFDCNYGAMLSVWDYLFGTQYRRYDVYPETGIDDDTFPAESAHSVSGVVGNVVRQMVYPFKRLWRMRADTNG
ncbi:MAG TPA: sterol desaturase family protein [Tepidisphaeraceae bacterium]|nr:sterol desaturase family protein [Tepidisphaeraceae bacterium]